MRQIRKASFALAVALFSTQGAYAAKVPQLDSTWFSNQLFWLLVSFVILYVFVARFLSPSIGQLLAQRETALAQAITEAEHANKSAQDIRHTNESGASAVRTQANELLANMQAEASREASVRIAKLEAELDRKLEKAEVRIGEARTKARKEMEASTVAVAQTMWAKLMGSQDANAALESAVSAQLKRS